MPEGHKVGGVILADHVKSVSWIARRADFIATCPEVGKQVVGRIASLLPG